ncbi:CARDB domain-containing protein [Geodermatophilus sp. URMC 64]
MRRVLPALATGLAVASCTVLFAPPATAVLGDGAVYAWGGNPGGALGTGAATDPLTTPARVRGLDAIVDSVDGGFAVRNDALVEIQAGRGAVLVPPPEVRTGGYREVSAGRNYQLARTKLADVLQWVTVGGADVSTPTVVEGLPAEAITAIGAGDDLGVALDGTSGTVWTWGANERGQLGRTTAEQYDPTPQPVPGLTGIVDIAVGWRHVVAIDGAGRVYTWGDGRDGQLGGGAFTESQATPGTPVGLEAGGFAGVEAGPFASYVITRDGRLYAFGDNFYGNLGRADDGGAGSGTDRPVADAVPKLVEGISDVPNAAVNPEDVVAASSTNLYVVTRDGGVLALGSNRNGGSGNGRSGATEVQPLPAPVPGITGAVAVEAHSDGLTSFAQAILNPDLAPPVVEEETTEEFGDGGGTAGTGTIATVSDPIEAEVTTTVAGTVTITEVPTAQAAPAGFTFFGHQVDITAPTQTVEDPLRLSFLIDASLVPPGESAATVQLFRDGQPIAPCESDTQAIPDPCVLGRGDSGGDIRIVALSSHASAWNVGLSAGAPVTANLSVQATAPGNSLVGSDVTATVSVRNEGPAAATASKVTVTLPAGAVRGATLPAGCTGTGPVTCTLGDLAAGASTTLPLTVTPVRPGTAAFGATVSTTTNESTSADNAGGTDTSVVGVACTKVGTQGNDRLAGTTGNDVLCGLGGNDTVLAGRGDDAAVGGSGNDTLDGEAGRDVVTGGTGKDVVRGGDGDDLLDVRDGAAGDSADGQGGRNLCTRDSGDTVTRCS